MLQRPGGGVVPQTALLSIASGRLLASGTPAAHLAVGHEVLYMLDFIQPNCVDADLGVLGTPFAGCNLRHLDGLWTALAGALKVDTE